MQTAEKPPLKLASSFFSTPHRVEREEDDNVAAGEDDIRSPSFMRYSPHESQRISSISERCEKKEMVAVSMDVIQVEELTSSPRRFSSNQDSESLTNGMAPSPPPFGRRMGCSFRQAANSFRRTWAIQPYMKSRSAAKDEDTFSVRSNEERVHITGNNFKFTACVIDPSTNFHYKWLSIVAVAVLYNLVFVIGRASFWQLNNAAPIIWYTLDYTADGIYIIDTFIHAHEAYLDQGIMVREAWKLRRNYFRSRRWRMDIISCLPTDIIYFFWLPTNCCADLLPCPVLSRTNRLFKIKRMLEFFEKTETKTGYPNICRICTVVFAILILIHWNSCLYFAMSYFIGFGTDSWVYDIRGTKNCTLLRQYIYSFYWSTLTLTTIGETPQPENDLEYMFVIVDFLAGVLIFATIVGNIGSMISNMNVARVEFQNKMDSVKQYMAFRKVSKELEHRVIRWFAYTWANKQALDEDRVLAALPDKLKAEIAIHVHLDTLKKVRIFKDCEPGLLEELVLKLRLQVFSPGDYICRKGDVGKEMYIVKKGRLNVMADDQKTVKATLGAGSVFGEVSVLDIAGNRTGNRRTANVQSVGYADLFCLAKKDLWETLTDYPEARQTLMERGCQILRKDRLLDEKVFHKAQMAKETLQERVERLDRTMEYFQRQLRYLMQENKEKQGTKFGRKSFKLAIASQFARQKRTKSVGENERDESNNVENESVSESFSTDYEILPGTSKDGVIFTFPKYRIRRRSFHYMPRINCMKTRFRRQNSF